MVKVSPWSVKGVEPEAREAAKIAARRAGMTVGQWLNHAIRAAAAPQPATPSRPPQDTIASEMAHYDETSGLAHQTHPPAPSNESVVENLLNRTDRTELKAEAAVVRQANQLEQVRSQAVGSTAPVDGAMQRLSERLEKIEASRKAEHGGRRRSLFRRDR